MTSGNTSGAPICRDDKEAVEELSQLCDLILSHDRKIRIRADDSVMDFYKGEPYMIRRSRGYAPLPTMVTMPWKGQVLAAGGALEALQEAKAAGKIGHIGLTAHSTEVFARALELDWVETIMFPYNIVESQGEELIAKCKEKNIGFIDMKPLAGGAIENGTLALRYICANKNVTIVIPGMAEEKEMEENIKACLDSSPLNEKELKEIEEVREQLGTNFCRRCNYCAPCSVGIDISGVFLFAGYLNRYGLGDWARNRYSSLAVKASACIECGKCETRCPYHLPIREMLKECAQQFGE